jgi:1,4-dihydroxy-6-naphthoate synthase
MIVRTWCSPDADDRFMMWAITEGHLDTGRYRFEVHQEPTDLLNARAIRGDADVCAFSFGSWPAIADRWLLLPHGGSMGEGYGPVVVARTPLEPAALAQVRVAVPGLNTTAYLVLRLLAGDVQPVVIPIVPYARIFDALAAGEVDAGLVIHEGRLTYAAHGLHRVVDLGVWWSERTGGLPLPLGGNAIRADLPPEDVAAISAILRDAIRYGLDHREQAIAWLLDTGCALPDAASVDEYLRMYANERTWSYGDAGRAGITALFAEAAAVGALPAVPPLRWAP